MPLIAGCKLYVDEKYTIVGHSLEGVRRLAVPYIDNRQAIKIEIHITSLPTQVWAYDYDIKSWILQR
jgi:hypothetical protein